MSHATVLVVVDGPEDRIEDQVAQQMFPFDEGREDAGWFADGSRWDWYAIGGRWEGELHGKNVLQKRELDLQKIHEAHVERLTRNWHRAQERKPEEREWWHGVKGDETLAEFLQRRGKPEQALSFYAFLRDKHWHEAERMGWFGCTAATECERKNPDWPLDNSKCLHKDESTGARIVNWQEPEEIWSERFYKRFIDPLPDDAYLVVVDYHV